MEENHMIKIQLTYEAPVHVLKEIILALHLSGMSPFHDHHKDSINLNLQSKLEILIEKDSNSDPRLNYKDETTEVSMQEQTSIGVRYLHNNGIREDFLQFVPVSDLTVSEIRNFSGTATKRCVFFNTPKRMEAIKRAIEKLFPEAKSTRLKQLCPTRWVECQEMSPAVNEALEEVLQWDDLELASMASQLICALHSSYFIISLKVMG
ncbi:unnamed protein product [Psylliodes chrysocephalus]|uniref:Uncharacterized protein n=1 Tax=Psylliodes chrysocephalus TaxID=3402493 RepID=A0A9P0DAR7_9CUCU|nr:unnamed protein product [Psylliodes chrysocephala]